MRRLLASRRAKIVLAACLAILLLAALCLGGYLLAYRNIQNNGITLSASRDIAPPAVEVYLQNDPTWAGDTIGNSTTTLGSAGCLISCAAMAISQFGSRVTPAQVNQAMTAVDGFDYDEFLWYRVKEAFPGLDYRYQRVFDSGTIERDLEDGLLPIVKVRYHGNGAQHWLLVVGAAGGEFLVIDPLDTGRQPVPLNGTHGRVYAYRVLVKA